MSKGFEARWRDESMDDGLAGVVLAPRLRVLIDARLVRKGSALVLEPLVTPTANAAGFRDLTGYEAFINKVHVEDFLDNEGAEDNEVLRETIRQGVKAAVVLSERLQAEGRYRVLLSLDSELSTLTLRFFERRDGEPWGSDNPDAYPLEDLLMIDT